MSAGRLTEAEWEEYIGSIRAMVRALAAKEAEEVDRLRRVLYRWQMLAQKDFLAMFETGHYAWKPALEDAQHRATRLEKRRCPSA